MKDSWTSVLRTARAQARKACARNLCLAQRIHYVQLCLLAKVWYLAQIFPPTHAHAQQLTTICSWFIWQGATFRVPMTTLQRPKHEGGWDFPNIEIKCKAFLYNRIQMLGAREGSVMSELMRAWNFAGAPTNPPYANRFSSKLTYEYLRQYITDMSYVSPYATDETKKKFKQRLYEVLLRLASTPSAIRIVRKFPGTSWECVWKNLHASLVSDTIKPTWYTTIHGIIPTNDRLATINLNATSACSKCVHTNPLQHRITECGEGPIKWNWARKKLRIMLE